MWDCVHEHSGMRHEVKLFYEPSVVGQKGKGGWVVGWNCASDDDRCDLGKSYKNHVSRMR